MSWTAAKPPDSADAPLRTLYERISAHALSGKVGHLWQTLGPDPTGLASWYEQYLTLMDHPAPLSSVQAEMLALVVSATNGCGYCVTHHGVRLARALGDEPLARAVARDYREANITARDRVLLDYAVALSCEPSERTQADIERVREYGFDDVAMLKATEITAYYNAVNRIASGLGVTLEPGLAAWEFGEQR
jgi:uncharacterized peroxidase-related enzyme